MTRQLRVGLALLATAGICLPVYRPFEPVLLLPLARGYAAATARVLAVLGVAIERDGTVLRHSPQFAVEVGVHCTAWIYLVLWIVALGALGPGVRRGLAVGATGVAALAVVNLARLVLVTAIGARSPAAFAWSHRFLGEALLLGTWLMLWVAAARERFPTTRPRASSVSMLGEPVN